MKRLSTRRALLLSIAFTTALIGGAVEAANTVYVTDELRLGLYDNEQTNGRPFETLLSGAKLDVLERALMSIRVRTESGSEGWVKLGYVVETEPARRRVEFLELALQKLAGELESSKAELASSAQVTDRLEAELRDARERNANLPALEAQNARLRGSLDALENSVPLNWLLAAAAITLILGFVIGYWWLDRRVRRQFGGVRVY